MDLETWADGATDRALFLSVWSRLTGNISQLNERNTFISDEMVPCGMPWSQGERFCSISYGGGSFDSGEHEGSGNIVEDGTLVVFYAAQSNLDDSGRGEVAITRLDRGLLAWKHTLLRWLTRECPNEQISDAWQPSYEVEGETRYMLMEPLSPISCSTFDEVHGCDDGWLGMALRFKYTLQPDLTCAIDEIENLEV